MEAYRECVAGRNTDAVRRSVAKGQALGIEGTPSFVIGVRDPKTEQVRVLQVISGAQPYDVFAKAIEAALKKGRIGLTPSKARLPHMIPWLTLSLTYRKT